MPDLCHLGHLCRHVRRGLVNERKRIDYARQHARLWREASHRILPQPDLPTDRRRSWADLGSGTLGDDARQDGRLREGLADIATLSSYSQHRPAAAIRQPAHLLAGTIRVEEDLIDQLFNSSEKRLARMLLLLANFGKEGRQEPVIANVSQETLAEMIGTTRSRVSFFMNKFRKLGFIHYDGGGLEVNSSLLNVILHDQPPIKM